MPRQADLKQADFFRVGVQTVRFGVQGEPGGVTEPGEPVGQLGVGIYHCARESAGNEQVTPAEHCLAGRIPLSRPPRRGYENPVSLHAEFAVTARRHPARKAILWGDEEVSYSRLLDHSLALGERLRREFGVQPGDRVAIWLKNRPELTAAIFGVWQAGGVVVMINHFQKPDEIACILHDSGARIVVTEAEFGEAVAKVGERVTGLRCLRADEPAGAASAGFVSVPRTESDLAALLYTSGTTGHPKGAMLSHGNLLHNVRSCLQLPRSHG